MIIVVHLNYDNDGSINTGDNNTIVKKSYAKDSDSIATSIVIMMIQSLYWVIF